MSRTGYSPGTWSCGLLMTSSAALLIIVTCHCCFCCCESTDDPGYSSEAYGSSHTGYACEGSELEIRCAGDTRIHVLNASYGRELVTMCNDHGDPDSWNLTCVSERSLTIVRNKCESAASCSLPASGTLLNANCSSGMYYVEVDYVCLVHNNVPSSTLTDDSPSDGLNLKTVTTTIATSGDVTKPVAVVRSSTFSTTTGNDVTSQSYCEQTTMRDIEWGRTAAGTTVYQPCPTNTQHDYGPTAVWRCSREQGRWIGQPDLSLCVSDFISSLKDKLNAAKGDLSVSVVNLVLDGVVSASKRRDLYGGDLRTLMSLLSDTVDRSAVSLLPNVDAYTAITLATNISSAVLTAGSSLLSDDQTQLWTDLENSLRAETAGQLAVAVETSGFMRASVENQPSSFAVRDQRNIALEIEIVSATSATEDMVFPKLDHSDDDWKKHVGSVRMPRSNLRKTSDDGLTRVVFASYSNLDRWLTGQRQGGDEGEDESSGSGKEMWTLNTKIISVSINGRKTEENCAHCLETPFEFVLEHNNIDNTSQRACSYWKFGANYTSGSWSSEGCDVVSSNSTHTTCSCNHLTNFAVLMSISGNQVSEAHEFTLSLITYFGCFVSLVCLVLAFLTFHLLKNLQCDRNTIHKNLVLCLFIAEFIFLIGIIQYENKILCSVVAGLLHYFFLAAFGWMCMEGIQLYAMLVEVFEAERSRIKWYYCGGYVVPAVIVIISASVYPAGYGTDRHCWLTTDRGFIWAFVGPVVVILAMNMVMLSVAIFTMCRHAKTTANWQMKQKTQLQNIGSWLKGSFVLVILLGLTWIFGLFYVSSETLFMAYLFTLCNSLQGLFIFVFHCLLSEKVQKEIRKWIQRTTWLPQAIRHHGDATGSRGGSTVPNQSASTGGGANYLAKLWGSRKGKNPSNCSDLKMHHVNQKDAADKVLIVVSSPKDNRRDKAALMTASLDSESARLTDSSSGRCTSGYSSSVSGNDSHVRLLQPGSSYAGWDSSSCSYAEGNTEDQSAYMDQTLTRLDEAEYEQSFGGSAHDADVISASEESIDHVTRLDQQGPDPEIIGE